MKTLLLASIAAVLGLSSAAHAEVSKPGATLGAFADCGALAPEEAREQGLNIQVAEFADCTAPDFGLHSLKPENFGIPENGSVAVADDLMNRGRGRVLLHHVGLDRLEDGVGFEGALGEIVENGKSLMPAPAQQALLDTPSMVRLSAGFALMAGVPLTLFLVLSASGHLIAAPQPVRPRRLPARTPLGCILVPVRAHARAVAGTS